MFVPTIVYYLPSKDKSAHLIGKFDKETIQKHEQKFVSGKLPTFEMKTKASDIMIQDLNCPNIHPEITMDDESGSSGLDKEVEDEILQEILREEQERMRKKVEERGDGKRGSSKKSGEKKGKKKKGTKKGKKEDL